MYRIGFGFDAHRFSEGRQLVLGGVEIPFERGLSGHSDADVLTHAICDALLGALGEGDIGTRFPDTDPRYKGRVEPVIPERDFETGNRGRVRNREHRQRHSMRKTEDRPSRSRHKECPLPNHGAFREGARLEGYHHRPHGIYGQGRRHSVLCSRVDQKKPRLNRADIRRNLRVRELNQNFICEQSPLRHIIDTQISHRKSDNSGAHDYAYDRHLTGIHGEI